MNKLKLHLFVIILAVLTAFTFSACEFFDWLLSDSEDEPIDDNPISGPNDPIIDDSYAQRVTRVEFTGPTATVTLNDLDGHDIYLVRVNTSNSVAYASGTGTVQNIVPNLSVSMSVAYHDSDIQINELPKSGRPSDEYILFPPLSSAKEAIVNTVANFVPHNVGNTKNFWVETFYGSGIFTQRSATLTATGTHSNIWVIDNTINTTHAQNMAAKFDIIYPAATNILGYEYGGRPGHPQPGGRDGDLKIQILVFDILDSSGEVTAGGYYSGVDYFLNSQISRSNEAEMFYVNASTVRDSPNYTYSLLAHEFQHMVNFNVKYVEANATSYPQSWYNEMLSMMTEDVIAEFINIPLTDNSHPIRQGTPRFLTSYYEVGITEWGTGNPSAVLSSYDKAFAFGAFLLRNYGGADLLRRILANNTMNLDSIRSALNEITPGLTFEEVLIRYGEAMVFSGKIPSDVKTFHKTVSNTINGRTYRAHGFDIWNMQRRGSTGRGPEVFNLNQRDMRPHSVTLHSDNTWKNKKGSYSITLQKPSNPDVVLVLMVK